MRTSISNAAVRPASPVRSVSRKYVAKPVSLLILSSCRIKRAIMSRQILVILEIRTLSCLPTVLSIFFH